MSNVPDGTFVEAISALTAPSVEQIGRGQHVIFSGGTHIVEGEPPLAVPDTLKLTTLTGIVDYIKSNHADESVVVHVVSPNNVQIVAPVVGEERQRFVYASATPFLPEYRYGNFSDTETFIINLQSQYSETADRERVLRTVGGLSAGIVGEIADDGVSQSITSRKGVTRQGEPIAFQNPVLLSPYRTFPEVEQPISPFIFRLNSRREGDNITALAALFEADGGAWRAEAVRSIGEYLRKNLPDGAVVLA